MNSAPVAGSSVASVHSLDAYAKAAELQAPLHASEGALKRQQHTATSGRHKRLKMAQRESMTSVDDDQESLQVRLTQILFEVCF